MVKSSASITPNRCNPKTIGVGITTTPNRVVDHRLYEFSLPTTTIIIKSDTSGCGAARMRNSLLADLEDHDYIFLLDDDCFPVMKGWEQYFIDQSEKHGVDYITLPESFKSELICVDGEMCRWDIGIGAFTFQTQKALQTIGGYNTNYVRYGFEDVGRNHRAYMAGLTGGYVCSCPIRSLAYIHSMDVFNETPPQNLSHEEKMTFVEQNKHESLRERLNDQLFYPFT